MRHNKDMRRELLIGHNLLKYYASIMAIGIFLGLPSNAFAVVNSLNVTGVDPETVIGGFITFPDGGTARVKRAEDCEEDQLENDDDDCPKAGFYFESDRPMTAGTAAQVVLDIAGGGSVRGFATMGANGLVLTLDQGAPNLTLPSSPGGRSFVPWIEAGASYLSKPKTMAFRLERGGEIQEDTPVNFRNRGVNAAFAGGFDYNPPGVELFGLDLRFSPHIHYYRDKDETFIPEVLTGGYDFGVPSPAGDPSGLGAGYLFSGSFDNTARDIEAQSKQRIIGGGIGITGSEQLPNGGILDIGSGLNVTNYRMKEDLSLAIPFFAVDVRQHTDYDDTVISPFAALGWTSRRSPSGFSVFGRAEVSADIHNIDLEQTASVFQNGVLLGTSQSPGENEGELGDSSQTKLRLGYNFTLGVQTPEVAGVMPELRLDYRGGDLPKPVADGIEPVTARMSHFHQVTIGLRLRF
ncbi:MAG: hypothetical protein Kow00104_00320 [Rhodothalassiaceae bacterium]